MILDNPIFQREGIPRFWRRSSPARRKVIVFVYLVVAALPAIPVLYYWNALEPEIAAFLLMPLTYWPSFLAPVIAPALTAGAIAGERERRTWDLLVVTRLTPAEIIWAKLLSRLVPLLWITILLVPVTAVLLIRGGGSAVWGGPPAWLFVLGTWFSGLAVTFANAVMALYVSLRCSNTRAAIVIAYGVAVGAYFFVTMIIGVLAVLVMMPNFMSSSWMPSAPGPVPPLPPPSPAHTMIWITAASYGGPLLWGLGVPAILLPIMVRRFSRINSNVRAA